VDEAPEIAAGFQVSSIPALMLIHEGKAVANMVRITPADRLVAMIDKLAARVQVTDNRG
jgi:thioredoxin-like negative regulator of GroEL